MSQSRSIVLSFLPQWSINQPPIGIAYLSAYLQHHGYTVSQRDLSIEMYGDLPAEKKYICESQHHENFLDYSRFHETVGSTVLPYIEKWAQELANHPSSYLGFTVLSSNRIPTMILLERVKQLAPHKTVIVGGPHCTRYEGGYEFALLTSVDYVIPDEGEEVLVELLNALENKASREEINAIKGLIYFPPEKRQEQAITETVKVNKGIMVQKDVRLFDTGERDLIRQINDLPIPDFSGFKLELYDQATIPILGSRGCIYKCTFCSETVLWKRFRYRTGENIFKEFLMQTLQTKIRSFYIVDSLINGSIKELEAMCDHIIASKLTVYWGGKVSIREEMSRELLDKMYQAGCRNLDYGIESGSPKILADMKKGFKLPTATRVLRDSTAAGIQVGIFMMVGFPTETEEDYQLSKDFMVNHKSFLHHVTPGYGFGVQPGSDTWINQEKYGIKWQDGNWYSENITPEVLQFRVRDFREFCEHLGVIVT